MAVLWSRDKTKSSSSGGVGVGWEGTCNNPLIYCSFKPQLFNNQMLTRADENKAQTQTCADADAATGIC